MPICKITVLKKMFNQDLADQYRRPDVHCGPCPYYTEGQEFIVRHAGERPADFFCDWAWNDIHKILQCSWEAILAIGCKTATPSLHVAPMVSSQLSLGWKGLKAER